MADIGNFFKEDKKKIVDLIDHANSTESLPRPYLGMSQLGDKCMRKLWFYFRWCAKHRIDGRVNRIFATGHKAEELMVKDLESIGVECWDTLDAQDAFVAVNGHCKGHGDGKAKGIPGSEKTTHLLEFKTSNDKLFNDLKKKGVQEAKPVHYAQMVLYMYMSDLTRALYMVYNKNDSSYYTERVKQNTDLAKELLQKAEDVITSEDFNQFPRIGTGQPNFFECKFCDYSNICFMHEKPVVTCRTCSHVSLLDDGKWGCGKSNDDELEVSKQELACCDYEMMACFDNNG